METKYCLGMDASLWKTVQKLGRIGRNPSETALVIFVHDNSLRAVGRLWAYSHVT